MSRPMNTKHSLFAAIALGSLTVMTACARTPEPANSSNPATASQTPQTPSTTANISPAKPVQPAAAALPLVVVHKSPSCTCCGKWVQHLRQAGFEVDVRNTDDLEPVKNRLGVPYAKHTCHTAQVGGYFVEGHVPVEDVKRLLAEKPQARGLALPGMPAGSPGMEMPDGRHEPYTVELVGRDGTTTAFARH